MVRDDYIAFVSKLNRLTQEGKIEWERIPPPRSLTAGSDTEVAILFRATAKDQNIGLWEERYQDYNAEFDRLYWATRLMLGLFDEDWTLVWEFPANLSGLWELMDSVKQKVGGVDNFLSDFLKEDS